MAIRLEGKDIVDLWETIKFACDQADDIGDNKQEYFNGLLCDLLCKKAQCFVRIDSERKLETIIITRIMIDNVRNEKVLLVQCLYSWTVKNMSKWKEDIDFIRSFAVREKCSYIRAVTRSSRSEELAKSLGMDEITRIYSVRV